MNASVTEQPPPAAEFLRYFSLRYHGLMSCRNDGTVMILRLEDEDWKLFGRKKPEVALEDWIADSRKMVAALPAWCQKVTELPSLEKIEEWTFDGDVETPSGDTVDPDGVGPDGAPSWLRCLGMV